MDLSSYFTTALVGLVVFLFLQTILKQTKNVPPGPLCFPIVGALPWLIITKKEPPEIYMEWKKRYGNIFGVKIGAMNIVVANDYESIQKVMHHPDLQGRTDVGLEFIYKELQGSKGLVGSSGTEWKLQRQFFLSKFRQFGIGRASFEDAVVQEACLLTKEIENKKQQPFDPFIFLPNASANVISKVALGIQFDYGDPTFKRLHQIFNENLSNLRFLTLLSMFPLVAHLPLPQKESVKKNVRAFSEWINDIFAVHKQNYDEDNVDDLMYCYMQKVKHCTQDESLVFNNINLITTLSDLFLAGTETTSTTLNWALLFFVLNPQLQERFQKQLDEVVGRSRMPRIADHSKLPFVEATIQEVQRMGDITALGVPHEAEKDVNIFGYDIPKGTIIQGNLHALAFDPTIWEDPKVFRPERHLDQEGNFIKAPMLLPFGTGGHQCLGEPLARMELYIFLTHLLHRFTFKLPKDAETPSTKPVFGLTTKPLPYKICAIPRE